MLIRACTCFTLGMAEKCIELAEMLRWVSEGIWRYRLRCDWLREWTDLAPSRKVLLYLPLMKLSRWITGQVDYSTSVACCVRSVLQVSTSPYDDARGGWVTSCGPGARSLRWCQDRGTSIMWQDKVGGFWYCIHAWAVIQLGGSRCGVVTPLHRDGRVSTSKHVNW